MTKVNTLQLTTALQELPGTAKQLLQYGGQCKVWLFEGDMGAGKTTLIKALCAELGVEDIVNSPTFSIVQEYCTRLGDAVYHFDFYRISSTEEALDLGLNTYLTSGSYCFIEWPSRIDSLLDPPYCHVALASSAHTERRISITRVG